MSQSVGQEGPKVRGFPLDPSEALRKFRMEKEEFLSSLICNNPELHMALCEVSERFRCAYTGEYAHRES